MPANLCKPLKRGLVHRALTSANATSGCELNSKKSGVTSDGHRRTPQPHRKDREEYKTLWRDAQRQITNLAQAQGRTEQAIAELAVETRFRIDQRLEARIESLVSAIGQLLPPKPQQQ